MRRFIVTLEVMIDVDDAIIHRCLTPEWRNSFYDLKDAGEVAEHLAYNLSRHRDVRSLDGFADSSASSACLLDIWTAGANEVERS